MGVSVRDIVGVAADLIQVAYSRVPVGAIKDGAIGALAILRAIQEVMDTSGMSARDMVKGIKRLPNWEEEPDDEEIDRILNSFPHKPES